MRYKKLLKKYLDNGGREDLKLTKIDSKKRKVKYSSYTQRAIEVARIQAISAYEPNTN